MKKIIIAFLLATALSMAAPARSTAGWDISIAIPLPGLYYYAAPQVVPAPGYYGYAAPVVNPVFYGGYWYRPSGGRWFISAQVAGPWYGIAVESVPVAVMRVPVYQEAGRGHDGRYIPPRLWYEDGGRHGGGHGHHDD